MDRAKEIIRSTGFLELKIVEQGPASTREALLQNGQNPQGMDIVPGVSTSGGDAGTVFYLVRKAAAVTGRELRNARPVVDENNRPAVGFTLNNEGATKFSKATGDNIGRLLAIVLDGRVQSAATIESRIGAEGRITGSFTQEEVQNLSLILRSGALPASLTYLEERTIAPSLDAFLSVVKKDGGTVEKVDIWGKRRLAFEINKNTDGIYAVIDLQAEPASVLELDRQLNLNESVLRTKVLRPDAR